MPTTAPKVPLSVAAYGDKQIGMWLAKAKREERWSAVLGVSGGLLLAGVVGVITTITITWLG